VAKHAFQVWCVTSCPHEDVCLRHISHCNGTPKLYEAFIPKITPLTNGRYRFECDGYILDKGE